MAVKAIVGRLGGQPEVRVTQAGKSVVAFSVAETKRKFNRDSNQWDDDFTLWHDVESWRNTDAIAALPKGALVVVVGEERDASYTHRESGKTVRRVVVRAETVGQVVTDRQGAQPSESWATPGQDAWAPASEEAPF